MNEEKCRKGQVIFREGDEGDCMFYIRWGSVGVFLDYGTPRERQLATLREGDYFGEMSLIDHAARTATVVVLDRDTELSRIGANEFAEFLATDPAKVQDILRQLSHRLRKVTNDYLEVCAKVQQHVGAGATEVDEESAYHFADDERLTAIHDDVAQSLAQEA